jgi:hypothetical protein
MFPEAGVIVMLFVAAAPPQSLISSVSPVAGLDGNVSVTAPVLV